jgi:hypothetical protein
LELDIDNKGLKQKQVMTWKVLLVHLMSSGKDFEYISNIII